MKILHHDILVIGSGSGGLTTSLGLKYAGKDVGIIEKSQYMGGDCTNTGCVPSKALLHVAKHTPQIGIVEAMKQMREKRNHFREEENPKTFSQTHSMPVYEGTAQFVDDHTVAVYPNDGSDEFHITAKKIIVAVGGTPRHIPIQGVHQKKILTSENFFGLQDLKNLVIIGGGYIGCEMSEACARLGVDVTLIQRSDRLINNEEPEISERIEKLLTSVGVTVLTSSEVTSGDEQTLVVHSNGTTKIIPYEYILQAIGRVPTTSLSLDQAGIEYSTQGIVANQYSQTNKKHIFAIGDCVAKNPQFTHRVDHEGRVLVRNLLAKMLPFFKKSRHSAILPMVMYTSLEVARVGMTIQQLEEFYTPDEIRTVRVDATTNDRDFLDSIDGSYVIVHFTRTTGTILGATILGPRAGEMIHTIQLAMQRNISAWSMMWQINAYPTYSRVFSKVRRQFVFGFIKHAKADSLYLLKSNAFKIGAIVALIVILGGFFWFKSSTGLDNSDIIMHLYSFFANSMRGPVLFILACTVRPLVLFPAVLFTILGGVLFGPIWGVVYVLIGEMMGATVSWSIGKLFGKGLVKPQSQGLFSRIKGLFDPSNALISVFGIRLIPMNFDIVNYSLGILQVPYTSYFWGTVFGILPPLIATVLAGASLDISQGISREALDIKTSYIILAVVLYALGIGFAVFAKQWIGKKGELTANS